MIRNEDNASLQLQDADGRFYLLMKSSLVSVQRKTGDPMPVDYGQRLSGSELDDLSLTSCARQQLKGKDEAPHLQD